MINKHTNMDLETFKTLNVKEQKTMAEYSTNQRPEGATNKKVFMEDLLARNVSVVPKNAKGKQNSKKAKKKKQKNKI